MLLLKDKPTYMYMYKIMPLSPKPTYMHMYMYAASFKLSSTPKNILADILEMPLIDLLPNNFHRLKNFFICLCLSLRQNAHFLFRNQ